MRPCGELRSTSFDYSSFTPDDGPKTAALDGSCARRVARATRVCSSPAARLSPAEGSVSSYSKSWKMYLSAVATRWIVSSSYSSALLARSREGLLMSRRVSLCSNAVQLMSSPRVAFSSSSQRSRHLPSVEYRSSCRVQHRMFDACREREKRSSAVAARMRTLFSCAPRNCTISKAGHRNPLCVSLHSDSMARGVDKRRGHSRRAYQVLGYVELLDCLAEVDVVDPKVQAERANLGLGVQPNKTAETFAVGPRAASRHLAAQRCFGLLRNPAHIVWLAQVRPDARVPVEGVADLADDEGVLVKGVLPHSPSFWQHKNVADAALFGHQHRRRAAGLLEPRQHAALAPGAVVLGRIAAAEGLERRDAARCGRCRVEERRNEAGGRRRRRCRHGTELAALYGTHGGTQTYGYVYWLCERCA